MTSCPHVQRTAFPAALLGARSWRSHFVQPTTTLLNASEVDAGLAVVGVEALPTCGTVNEVPHGHFELCPAKLGLISNVRWQLVQLCRIILLTNVEGNVDLLRHSL